MRSPILLPLAALVLVLCGCASPAKKLESRKQEKAAAYAALPPESQSLVDQGQIKVGMPMDAVYIAWGQPSQILQGEGPGGAIVTWLYSGQAMQEIRYWGHRPYYGGRRGYYAGSPYLTYDYIPRSYVSAEVNFQGGLVVNWRTHQQPQ